MLFNINFIKPVKNDWSLTVNENLNELKISFTEYQIQNMSYWKIRHFVKEDLSVNGSGETQHFWNGGRSS